MKNIQIAFFLFSNILNKERIKWISSVIHGFDRSAFLTNDSVYSIPMIQNSLNMEIKTEISYNIEDTRKRGISLQYGSGLEPTEFYRDLFLRLKNTIQNDKLGYLCLHAPYMTNDALAGLTLLNHAMENGLDPEFYGYLDALHLLQPGQAPSEFINVKDTFLKLKADAQQKNKACKTLFCSRCATARGYMNTKIIEGASIVNLREIIYRLKQGVPCLMADSLLILNPNYTPENINQRKQDSESQGLSTAEQINDSPPIAEITILLSHSPYNSEYMFGGLSFGLACANQGINTQIIFIEDSTYALIKQDSSRDFSLHGFDILSVVEALDDTENLTFYYYYPSLRERSLSESLEIQYNFIRPLDVHDLGEMLKIQNPAIKFRNVLIF